MIKEYYTQKGRLGVDEIFFFPRSGDLRLYR